MSNEESKPSPSSDNSSPSNSGGSTLLKLLVLVLVLAGGSVAVLYTLGGSPIVIQVSETANAGDEDLFQFRSKIYYLMTEPKYVMEWCEGVTEISELVEPDEDIKGHRVGAMAKVTVEADGKSITFDEKVTKVKKFKETEIEMTSDEMDLIQNYKFDFDITGNKDGERPGGNVTIVHTCTVKFKGLARIMAIFSKGAIEEKLKKNLASLVKMASETDKVDVRKQPSAPPTRRNVGGRGKGRAGKNSKGKNSGKDSGKGSSPNKKEDSKSEDKGDKKSGTPAKEEKSKS